MALTGRCYCGAVRYEAAGEPRFKGQCHCRECQYMTGGAENYFMLMPSEGFRYTEGAPKQFTRPDLATPVTREFCANCGTSLVTRLPNDPSSLVLKVGTLDDPAAFGGPQMAIWTQDAQPFHLMPEGVPQMATMPGR
jgi:hypothetical protein